MRKLLETKHVVIKELKVVNDANHRQKEIRFFCEPNIVGSTGRMVTKEQLASVMKMLYPNEPSIYENVELETVPLHKNLLSSEGEAIMVFSENTLIAIGKQGTEIYCYLRNGESHTEKELFELCKKESMERTIREMRFHFKKYEEYMERLQELQFMEYEER